MIKLNYRSNSNESKEKESKKVINCLPVSQGVIINAGDSS